MEALPLHPALVHLPLGLAFVLPIVAIVLLLRPWADRAQRGAWHVLAALQLLVAVSAFAAMRTGEAEEERVENVVPESKIEAHEERAESFLVLASLGALLTAAASATPKPALARIVGGAAAIVLLGAAGAGVLTGKAGGELVYRHGAATAYARVMREGPNSAQGTQRGQGGSAPAEDEDDD